MKTVFLKLVALFLGIFGLSRMALTFSDIVVSGTITLRDFGKQLVPINYRLVTQDPAQADTDVKAIAGYLKAITGLQIARVGYNLAYETVGDDATGLTNPAPSFGAEREHYSVFEVTKGDGEKATLMVPGPIQAILNSANPDYVEYTQADVDAYLDMYKTTGTNLVTIGDQSIVGNPSAAYTRHKESKTKVTRQKLG